MNLVTLLILLAVLILFGACLRSFLKRLTGKQSCCETKAEPPKKKKLDHIMGRYLVRIEGMRCNSCKNVVIQALNELEGVSAKVSLEKRQAEVAYNRVICKEEIQDAIERAGYEVLEIREVTTIGKSV